MEILKNRSNTEEILISTRLYNVLSNKGIYHIEDIFEFDKNELMNLKNLGDKSRKELDNIFNKYVELKKEQIREIFVLDDGKEYYDIHISELELSKRAYNCLLQLGVEKISEILELEDKEICELKNLGEKTFVEIKRLKRKIRGVLERVERSGEEKEIEILAESISEKVIENVKKFGVEIEIIQIYRIIFNITNKYYKLKNSLIINDYIEDMNFLKELYSNEYVFELMYNIIYKLVEVKRYGISENDIISKLTLKGVKKDIIKMTIDKLKEQKIIAKFEDRYIINYNSIVDVAKSSLNERQYEIYMKRITGLTLEKIATDYSITRERVRQIISKCNKKINIIVKEDIYEELLLNYHIEKNDFEKLFKDNIAYSYIYTKYDDSKNEKKLLEEIFKDTNIPSSFKRICEKIVYKGHVMIGSEYIKCSRYDLSTYLLKNYATDEIKLGDFIEIFNMLVEDLNLKENIEFKIEERNYENQIIRRNDVLWKLNKRLRYYPINNYDYEELTNTLNLKEYTDSEYSTLKFFKLYPDLMKMYDIRDEYELHNLLKKIYNSDDNIIKFQRMPNIEIGTPSRENQVLELLKSMIPISINEFCKEYEETYGVASATVNANYLDKVKVYLENGVFDIKQNYASEKIINSAKEILVKEIYFIEEAEKILLENITNIKVNEINGYLFKNVGFRIYSNYIIINKYATATEYFYYLLMKNNIFKIKDIDIRIRNLVIFNNFLSKMKNEYNVIEYLPGEYINFSRLQENNIDLSKIIKFKKSVYRFVGQSKYFTLKSIKEDGFDDELFDLGFEDWFYTSIIVEDRSNISYKRIGNNKLMIYSESELEINLAEFIESIVYNTESLSIEVYELLEILKDKYDIVIDKVKLMEIIKNSDMFFNAIYEKIFANYDTYFEEV